MSDIRFEGWLHRSGTGGVYQDSAGNVGIASTQPKTRLDIGNGGFQVGPTGIATVTTVNTTNLINATQLSHRNLIINGAMQVAQRGTSYTGTDNYNTVDRILTSVGGLDENCTFAQVDVSSGTAPYTSGFRKAFKITNGNQSSGAGSGDYVQIQSRLEAQNVATSGWNYTSSSSYITLQFWVKSSVAQNFYCYLRTKDGTGQGYIFETGSLTADTWTKIEKTIPGNSNITINNDNGEGLQINISPFWGTDFTSSSASLNTWGTFSGSARTPDHTSTWYTTNDATFEITGLQLEVGSVATPFEHRIHGDELRRCQRYFFTVRGDSNQRTNIPAFANSTTECRAMVSFPTPMRATPTFSGSATNMVFDSSDDSATFLCSALQQGGSMTNTDPHGMLIEVSTSSMTAGQAGVLEFRADNGELNFSAEL